ncbi:MAG: hypothetical protein ABSE77_23395 [Acidimicrobiales bacterium]|jgi:hypothetical protein
MEVVSVEDDRELEGLLVILKPWTTGTDYALYPHGEHLVKGRPHTLDGLANKDTKIIGGFFAKPKCKDVLALCRIHVMGNSEGLIFDVPPGVTFKGAQVFICPT